MNEEDKNFLDLSRNPSTFRQICHSWKIFLILHIYILQNYSGHILIPRMGVMSDFVRGELLIKCMDLKKCQFRLASFNFVLYKNHWTIPMFLKKRTWCRKSLIFSNLRLLKSVTNWDYLNYNKTYLTDYSSVTP